MPGTLERRLTARVQRSRILASAVLAFGLSAAIASGAPEPDAAPPLEGWAYEMANDLMSPFCPGKTLADCTSPQAGSLRMWIVVQEAAGRSRTDVEEELFGRYGDVLRAAPLAEGFGLAAYAFPVAAFVAGGVLVAAFLRRQMSASAAAPAPVAAPHDPELERIIDEELAR